MASEWTTIRVHADLRERIKVRADAEGVSVAQWSERALAAALGNVGQPEGSAKGGGHLPAPRRASASLAIDKGKPLTKEGRKRGR